MRGEICSREGAVVRAVRSGAWTESLEAHARECAICREVQESVHWMRVLAREGEAQSDLPDARTLWLRAQLQERQSAMERAQRLAQWIEIACAMAICGGLGVRSWREVGGAIVDRWAWVFFEGWPALWTSLYSYNSLDTPVLFSGAIMALTVIALALAYPLVARE